jgi:ADP-heptose:LPS heptosyltransferase
MEKLLKKTEKWLKRQLDKLLRNFLRPQNNRVPSIQDVQKVLVFRLDQRIGNGILLIPLLRAIRSSSFEIEIHLLIHHPVAELLQMAKPPLANRIWAYHQAVLLKQPWRLVKLVLHLRRHRFDVILSSNNPDGFSFSQAVFGRLCRPRWLIGFDAKSGSNYFFPAVRSSNHKHYSDAMIDLWRVIDPSATYQTGGVNLPGMLPETERRGILFWLGATGKKILPANIIIQLDALLKKMSLQDITYACGPADEHHVQNYPAHIRKNLVIWKAPLPETAKFFSRHQLFISGDTGPMHLAVALGIATLTIFVDSNIVQYGYQQKGKHYALLWTDDTSALQAVKTSLKELLSGLGE